MQIFTPVRHAIVFVDCFKGVSTLVTLLQTLTLQPAIDSERGGDIRL